MKTAARGPQDRRKCRPAHHPVEPCRWPGPSQPVRTHELAVDGCRPGRLYGDAGDQRLAVAPAAANAGNRRPARAPHQIVPGGHVLQQLSSQQHRRRRHPHRRHRAAHRLEDARHDRRPRRPAGRTAGAARPRSRSLGGRRLQRDTARWRPVSLDCARGGDRRHAVRPRPSRLHGADGSHRGREVRPRRDACSSAERISSSASAGSATSRAAWSRRSPAPCSSRASW